MYKTLSKAMAVIALFTGIFSLSLTQSIEAQALEHASEAMSAFDVITPPGAANAAVSSAVALAGSAFDIRSASRARSELENFSHFAMSPL